MNNLMLVNIFTGRVKKKILSYLKDIENIVNNHCNYNDIESLKAYLKEINYIFFRLRGWNDTSIEEYFLLNYVSSVVEFNEGEYFDKDIDYILLKYKEEVKKSIQSGTTIVSLDNLNKMGWAMCYCIGKSNN